MALSGSFTGSIYSGHYSIKVEWSATQDIAKNTSTITAKYYFINDYSISIGSRTNSVRIDDTYFDLSSNAMSTKGTHYLGSKSKTVTHNNDGTKQVFMSAAFKIKATLDGTYYEQIYASKTITLNTIPRASSISWGSGTSSRIGLTDGTTIKISSASSTFTHTLTYSFGTKTGTIVTKTTKTSISWTIPKNFANEIPNSTTGTGKIYCYTYNGNTLIGTSELRLTCNLWKDDGRPTISNFNLTLDNSSNDTVNSWGIAVSGYTKLKFTASASGIYDSTIKSFRIVDSGNDNKLLWSPQGSSLNYTTGVLNCTSLITKKYKADALDSRGYDSYYSTEKSIIVYPYNKPSITYFNTQRNSLNNKLIDIDLGYNFASVDNKNSATATLKYKKTNETNWATYGTIQCNGSSVTISNLEFEEYNSYNLQIIIQDSLGNSAVTESIISTIEVLMDWNDIGTGISFGKTSEEDGFEINMPTYFITDDIYIGVGGNRIKLDQYIKNVINS